MSRTDLTQPINCADARPLIDAHLLGELAPAGDKRLAEHLRVCKACWTELGDTVRLIGLLTNMQTPPVAEDLDERIILAAVAARQRRHQHRSWLSELPYQVFRGAMRTTGTLVVTILTVALLGGTFVFAVSGFITQTAQNLPPRATVAPEVSPTLAPTPERTAVPTAPPEAGKPTPAAIVATPEPTASPTPAPTPESTLAPTPEPTPVVTPEPTPVPSATAEPTPEPTPTPTPEPTEKPRRTPPPSPSPSPSNSTTPSEASPISP